MKNEGLGQCGEGSRGGGRGMRTRKWQQLSVSAHLSQLKVLAVLVVLSVSGATGGV